MKSATTKTSRSRRSDRSERRGRSDCWVVRQSSRELVGRMRNAYAALSQIVELAPQQVTQGIRDEDWPIDPEGIARHLRLMDRIEPLEFTPEEEVALQAARKAQKDCDIANFEELSRRIESQWT